MLGCVCFGWKSLPEIIFPQTRMFGCHGKWYFPKNDFRLTNIFTFDPEMIFSPHFHFKAFPEKERERERERERARVREEKKPNSQSDDCRRTLSSRWRRSPVRRSLRRSRSTVRSRDASIAISPSRDRAVDRDLAFDRDRDQRRDLATRRSRDRAGEIAIVDDSFLRFVFSFFFSKHQKIFSGKFFEMQPNTWKYFPFPEISISGKYVFFGNVLRQPNTA